MNVHTYTFAQSCTMYTSTDMSIYRSFSAFLPVLTALKEAFLKTCPVRLLDLKRLYSPLNFYI